MKMFSRYLAGVAACVCLFFGTGSPTAYGQSNSSGSNAGTTIRLKSTAHSPNNILRLRDIADVVGDSSSNLAKTMLDAPIAPTPTQGNYQDWNVDELKEALRLRGIAVGNVRWEGSRVCRVERSVRKETAGLADVRTASVDLPQPAMEHVVTSGSNAVGVNPQAATASPTALRENVDPKSFTKAFVNPTMITQAERVVISALENYLQTKTDSTTSFQIKPVIPPEHAHALVQRRHVMGVSGGTAPYDGPQHFEIWLKTSEGEQTIPIQADVQLPELVLVASKQLAKGHWIRREDLQFEPIPKGFKEGVDQCYLQMDELVGKELKRSMSAQQVIRRTDAGPPVVIHAGDAIKIEVIVSGLIIETNGRAMESGGIDDLIQIETAEYRKRLVARVRSDRTVEVYTQGAAMPTVSKGPVARTARK